jgi:hypothetical protein
MANKKIIIGIVVVIILAIAVIAGVLLINQNQDVREKAAPATTMYIDPANQNVAPGGNFTYSVKLDTNENSVTGIDIKINYDPAALEVTTIQKGTGISTFSDDNIITNEINNTTGTLSYVIFTLDRTRAANGSAVEVLRVNGRVKPGAAAAIYNLTFDPSTSASASQEGQNVLIGKTAGKITVVASGATANPTATATAAAGATATPTSQATATATSSGNRTATPTVRATATATSTSSSNATATPTTAATATVAAGATASPFPIPETGMSLPTAFGVGFGLILLVVSLGFAL